MDGSSGGEAPLSSTGCPDGSKTVTEGKSLEGPNVETNIGCGPGAETASILAPTQSHIAASQPSESPGNSNANPCIPSTLPATPPTIFASGRKPSTMEIESEQILDLSQGSAKQNATQPSQLTTPDLEMQSQIDLHMKLALYASKEQHENVG